MSCLMQCMDAGFPAAVYGALLSVLHYLTIDGVLAVYPAESSCTAARRYVLVHDCLHRKIMGCCTALPSPLQALSYCGSHSALHVTSEDIRHFLLECPAFAD
jgi:hypothetical protein